MNFDKRIFRNLQLYSAALLAFLIPLSKPLSSGAIVLWAIASLMMWVPKGKNRLVKAGLWSMAVFYFLHLTGLIYTENMDFALLDLGMKTSFILMPVVWRVTKNFTSTQVDFILGAFVVSVVAKGLFLLLRAFWLFTSEGGTEVFFYSDFAEMHPSYSAMYALLAFSFLVLARAGMRNFFGFRQKWLFAVLLIFLLILVNLFASKAGVLLAPVLIIALGIFIGRCLKSVRIGFAYAASLLAIFVCTLFFSTNTVERFEKMLEETSDATEAEEQVKSPETETYLESTTARLDAWQATLELISKKPLLGTGTGDVKDELTQRYIEMGEPLMAEDKVNPHNQYLQSWAALGMPGILALLGMMVIGLFEGLRKRKYLLSIFIMLVGANIFVESMFEVQAGIVFFAFFYGLLLTERMYPRTKI